jgi:AbrB family looped-hinge helix DNA binding protein
MATMVTVSSKGQLVIPARIREKYRLKAGSRVKVEDRDGKITITPNPPDPYDAMLALRGIMSHIDEDVEGWWMEEKRKELEREEAL